MLLPKIHKKSILPKRCQKEPCMNMEVNILRKGEISLLRTTGYPQRSALRLKLTFLKWVTS